MRIQNGHLKDYIRRMNSTPNRSRLRIGVTVMLKGIAKSRICGQIISLDVDSGGWIWQSSPALLNLCRRPIGFKLRYAHEGDRQCRVIGRYLLKILSKAFQTFSPRWQSLLSAFTWRAC